MAAATGSSDLVCRPAQLDDTPAVLALCSLIWNGEDYIPEVWEDWLADSVGLLAVAELNGRLAGLGKLTRLLDDSWWLEGMRVHPEFRGRGYATQIFAYLHAYWLAMGSGLVRLTTYSENAAVHHMCAQLGYRKIIEFTPFEAPTLVNANMSAFTLLNADQVPRALEVARNSESLAACRGLVDIDWTWVDLNPDPLLDSARKGWLWDWKSGQGIVAGRVNTHPGESEALYAACLACAASSLGELLNEWRALVGEQGFAFAGWNAPVLPDLMTVLVQSGYRRVWEDGSLYLYEFCHPGIP